MAHHVEDSRAGVHRGFERFVGAEGSAKADVERAVADAAGGVEDLCETLGERQVGEGRGDGAIGCPGIGDAIKFGGVLAHDRIEVENRIEDVLDDEEAIVVEALDLDAWNRKNDHQQSLQKCQFGASARTPTDDDG